MTNEEALTPDGLLSVPALSVNYCAVSRYGDMFRITFFETLEGKASPRAAIMLAPKDTVSFRDLLTQMIGDGGAPPLSERN